MLGFIMNAVGFAISTPQGWSAVETLAKRAYTALKGQTAAEALTDMAEAQSKALARYGATIAEFNVAWLADVPTEALGEGLQLMMASLANDTGVPARWFLDLANTTEGLGEEELSDFMEGLMKKIPLDEVMDRFLAFAELPLYRNRTMHLERIGKVWHDAYASGALWEQLRRD